MTVIKHLRQRLSLHAGLIAASMTACTKSIGLDGWRTWQNCLRYINEAKVETANLAKSLAQHAHDEIAAADNAVLGVRNRMDGHRVGGKDRPRSRRDRERSKNLPGIQGLFIFDADGNWVASPNAVTPPASVRAALSR